MTTTTGFPDPDDQEEPDQFGTYLGRDQAGNHLFISSKRGRHTANPGGLWATTARELWATPRRKPTWRQRFHVAAGWIFHPIRTWKRREAQRRIRMEGADFNDFLVASGRAQ